MKYAASILGFKGMLAWIHRMVFLDADSKDDAKGKAIIEFLKVNPEYTDMRSVIVLELPKEEEL